MSDIPGRFCSCFPHLFNIVVVIVDGFLIIVIHTLGVNLCDINSVSRSATVQFMVFLILFRTLIAEVVTRGQILCFIFSLNPLKFSLMRKTDQKDQIQKLSNLKTFKSKMTKTPIFPNYQVPDGYFDISLQVIYDCSSFVSRYFFVSFSHERKCERIERKIKAQNPNLGLMFSSVSELLALELSSIIVAGLASIEAFS